MLPSGTSRETYFSPKSVLGTIEPVTSLGMVSISPGKMPRVSSAPSVVASKSSTSPTITPRTFTSARSGSCRPILLVCSVTSS